MLKQLARKVLPYDTYLALSRAKHFVVAPFEHEQLMKKRRNGERFLSTRVDTVTACNHRCQYCYTLDLTGHRTQLMSLDDFKKAAANLFPYSHTVALSCAWEPTMNKNLAEFIRVAASYDIPFLHFVSNGAFLTEEMMEAMVDCGLNRMAVSIDAALPETYEKIREVNDLARVLENLRKLKNLKEARGVSKPLVNINWTAFEENADEAVIFAREYGDLFDTFWFWHLLPRMRNTVNPFHRMDKDRFFGVVRQLREILGDRLVSNEFNNDRSNKPLGVCNRSLDNIRVEPDGTVEVTCSKNRLDGNILTEDFLEIYERNEPLFDDLYKKNTDFCRNDCGR
ncbi:radical SAM protein [Thalassospiraceae bacterium LMO-SO8]|nr:radical SAM protein [Alphaproteobacteria bacterium LMO-S08]WND77707.1 radical SAM protein [Thalassospiraceae bacterium LMO-SO8]